jgi:hypothetical protein
MPKKRGVKSHACVPLRREGYIREKRGTQPGEREDHCQEKE